MDIKSLLSAVESAVSELRYAIEEEAEKVSDNIDALDEDDPPMEDLQSRAASIEDALSSIDSMESDIADISDALGLSDD